MMFATRNKFKSVIATEAAALIAWSAAKNNDRVGGLIFSEDEHVELKPRRGKTAALDFIGRCTKHGAWSKTIADKTSAVKRNMLSAVSRLRKVTHPGSLIFMISDFRDMDEKVLSHIANLSRNNDIIFINISDPIEIELPPSGSYKLTDGEKELQLQTSNKKTREQYHQKYLNNNNQFERFCRQHRIHLVAISTADNVLETLKKGLGIKGPNTSARNSIKFRSN